VVLALESDAACTILSSHCQEKARWF